MIREIAGKAKRFSQRVLLIFFITLICSDANAQELSIASEKYNGQNIFSCAENDKKIPPYWAYNEKGNKQGLYLTAIKSKCNMEDTEVFFTKEKDCIGQAVCGVGSFRSYKNKDDGLLLKLLSMHIKPIKLSKNIEGYIVDSQCFSYCNEVQIVWLRRGKVFVIGGYLNNSKETYSELIKSANSYIDKWE